MGSFWFATMQTPSSLGTVLITTFGLGYMRPASGTWGSLPPAAIAGVMVLAGVTGIFTWIVVFAALALAFSLVCVLAGDAAEHRFGEKDPGQVVADETAGMAVTLLAIPWCGAVSTWQLITAIAVAFLAFRIMDIFKPPPANGLQKVPGGWGILLDDLVAGVYGGLVVLALRWVW